MKLLLAVLIISFSITSCNNSSNVSGKSTRQRDSIRVVDSLDSVEKQMKKEEADAEKTSADPLNTQKDTTGK